MGLHLLILLLSICPNFSSADTLPPGTVKLKGGTDGTVIGNIADAIKVNITGGSIPSTVDQGAGGVSPWLVTVVNFPATQPISAAALPLPSGASTAALQTAGNASLASINSNIPAGLSVTSSRLLVDGSGVVQP